MWKLAHDTLDAHDIDALAAWLRTYPHLTQGEQVRAFETQWSSWLGVRDSVMVSSGTTANFALLACVARHLGRRPRVGMAAVTWSTNVSPSLLLGHEVTLFDVSPRTLGVDPRQACDAMARGELDVLFVTHLLGFDALDAELVETAERHRVILLEDCCEAHGAQHRGKRVGTVGLAGTFSFYFAHHMSTIEGGMVSSDDPDLIDSLRLMRAHGLARESVHHERYAAAHPDVDRRFLFMLPGLNFRSTELNAFLGRRQLPRLEARIAARNANLEAFLAAAPELVWRDFVQDGVSSFALPLIARDAAAARRVLDVVGRLQLESRPVVAGNLLRQPMLRGYDVRVPPGGTPVADHIHQHGLYVGNGHHVTPSMARQLATALHPEAPS